MTGILTLKWVNVSVFHSILCSFFMIRNDPSLSELIQVAMIRPGLVVRVDPVRRLYFCTDCTKHALAGALIHRQHTIYLILTRAKLSSIYRQKSIIFNIGQISHGLLLQLRRNLNLQLSLLFLLFSREDCRNPRKRVARGENFEVLKSFYIQIQSTLS